MPRICPMQLLNCLSVLLSPKGGIKSKDEVQRLASLMTKFSKKLVSKCIYIQILKCTETELLGLFMGSGGWRLVHMWLTESIVAKNWPLVRELLELLLLCPVDIERLKTNNCPKLVKELSKDGNHYAIRALASKLVEQWLKTVKGEHVVPILLTDITHIISDAQTEIEPEEKNEILTETEQIECEINGDNSLKTGGSSPELSTQDNNDIVDTAKDTEKDPETLPVLKITLKNGKQIISQVDEDSVASDDVSDKDKIRDKHRSRSKEKSSDKSSSSSRSSSSKHSSKSSSDKYKSSHRSSSNKHSSKERSKDKEKHSSHSSKSKHNSSSGSSSSSRKSSSSSRSKDDKTKHSSEKEKSKDKDDKGKESPNPSTEKSDDKPSIHKLGKIPKLSDVKREKPSISIEVRKPDDPKPKTVKTFHSKFRKHGLEEEVKPPPSRAALLNKKPPPTLPPTIPVPKRSSPVHNDTPPEKKLKTVDIVEKPGAIKLIPPKPKRKEGPPWPMPSRKYIYLDCNSAMMLLESDMFMDALNASATNKKEPKKRKRRTSGSKDGNAPNDSSPPHTPTTVASPNSESKSVPPRFYQDTLDTEESSKASPEKSTDNNEEADLDQEIENNKEEKMDVSEPHTHTVNGLKGVLCYHKRKGPKKSIRWRPDSELEEIQYFELDETERVNVTKTFTDMKYLERIHEREAFQKGRNLSNDDVMEEKTSWKSLISIDLDGQIQVEYGKNSKEKDIQAIRQKGTLQPLYFHKSMIPDSPHEPDVETHTYSEPAVIPLDDVTGNQDNISDFRNMPWPEPKGNAPPSSNTNINVPTMFPQNMPQFPSNFPGTQFPGVPPGFQGAPMVPTDWPNAVAPNMMPNGIPGPMAPTGLPPGPIPPGNMPPGMMMPPENMMMGPEMFGAPNPLYPVPPEGFNMQQNMFPMDFNMAGPQVAPGPDGFNGPGNFRGAMRGRGGGWRGKGGGNWEGPPRGRGGHARGNRKVVCMYFQRKGSCRQGDNCTFLHPGVNCPF